MTVKKLMWTVIALAIPTLCDVPSPAQSTGGVPQPPSHQQAATAAPRGLRPPVEFHPQMLDFGTVPPNKRLQGVVHLHNVSDQWLKVIATKPDCTCTSAALSSDMIPPGGSVMLEAEYNANTVMGEKRGAVRILIEGHDIIELPVRAFVAFPVRAEPPYIGMLPEPSGREPISGEITVISDDQRAFRITAVNGQPPRFVDFNPASDAPRNRYRLRWNFSEYDAATCENAAGQRLPGWLVIETDHPDCPIFDLEVRHECTRRQLNRTDSWLIQERRLLLGVVKPGVPVEAEVLAKPMPGASLGDVPAAVVSESRLFTAELISAQRMEDGVRCRVKLTPAADHTGLIYGTIRFHSSAQHATLTVIAASRPM